MSDIGLHGSLYGEIRELAELVDLVISDMAVGRQDASSRRQLAERLADMTAAGSRGAYEADSDRPIRPSSSRSWLLVKVVSLPESPTTMLRPATSALIVPSLTNCIAAPQ